MLELEYTPKTVGTLLMGALMTKKPKSGHRNWAVWQYAIELTDNIATNGDDKKWERWDVDKLRDLLLNGARDYDKPHDELRNWIRYSEGGGALIWNVDIAKRVCTPSQYKKLENVIGTWEDKHEWIKIQARCLYDAAQLIYKTFNSMTEV